jgi:hypothetical protein
MPATRGSWTLHQALLKRWIDSGADAALRGLWNPGKQAGFHCWNENEARPGTPFPYVVYQVGEPQSRFRTCGKDALTEIDYLTIGLQLECFGAGGGTGQDVSLTLTAAHVAMLNAHFASKGKTRTVAAGSLGGKPAAQLVAEIVALAFDNQALSVDDDSHVQTQRGPDFPVRQDDTHWSWVLRYSVQIEAEYLIAPIP